MRDVGDVPDTRDARDAREPDARDVAAGAAAEQAAAEYRVARVIAEIVIGAIGALCLIGAFAARQSWLDRHFLPSFLLPRAWYVSIETIVRIALGLLGLRLVLSTRRRIGRFVAYSPSSTLRVLFAVIVAFVASEVTLQRLHPQPTEWQSADEEPRRQFDPRLGWTLTPARVGHNTVAGRVVDYAVDRNGYRVERADVPVDFDRQTIVFTGESVMFGEGLQWQESIPAQVSAMTGIQGANLAVHGFGNDQSYLRLQGELPRFHRPVAVVTIFMTALFGRNLDADRPHLGPGLVWLPAEPRSRLAALAKVLVPYRSDETIARGVLVTREVLRATIALAQSRGAMAVIVVPQLGREAEPERMLRERVLDEGGIPYLRVDLDDAWRLAWDRHPNAAAAHRIAGVVASAVSMAIGRDLHDK